MTLSPETDGGLSNANLLAQYAELMNRHGPDSAECMGWIYKNRHDANLLELAQISYRLKKGLTADRN